MSGMQCESLQVERERFAFFAGNLRNSFPAGMDTSQMHL